MMVGHCRNKPNKFTDAPENTKEPWTFKIIKRPRKDAGIHKHAKTMDATPPGKVPYSGKPKTRGATSRYTNKKTNIERRKVTPSPNPAMDEKIKHKLTKGQPCAKKQKNKRAN